MGGRKPWMLWICGVLALFGVLAFVIVGTTGDPAVETVSADGQRSDDQSGQAEGPSVADPSNEEAPSGTTEDSSAVRSTEPVTSQNATSPAGRGTVGSDSSSPTIALPEAATT